MSRDHSRLSYEHYSSLYDKGTQTKWDKSTSQKYAKENFLTAVLLLLEKNFKNIEFSEEDIRQVVNGKSDSLATEKLEAIKLALEEMEDKTGFTVNSDFTQYKP